MSEASLVKKKSGNAAPAKAASAPPQVSLAKTNLDKLERMLPEYKKVLSHIKPEYFLRVVLSAINRNPKILQCTWDSIAACVMDLATLNLPPDPTRGFAWLIPYGTECQLQVGYQGYAELLYRGDVALIVCNMVCQKDFFEQEYGTNAHLTHKPVLGKRGKKIGAYSYVKFKDGMEMFISMDMDELNAVRAKSKKDKNGHESPAWREFEDEMYKKCVFRRHFKLIPRVDESIRKIIEDDIDKDFDLDPDKEVQQSDAPRAQFDASIPVPQDEPEEKAETIDAEYSESESEQSVPQEAPATQEDAPTAAVKKEPAKRTVRQAPSDPKVEAEVASLPFLRSEGND